MRVFGLSPADWQGLSSIDQIELEAYILWRDEQLLGIRKAMETTNSDGKRVNADITSTILALIEAL